MSTPSFVAFTGHAQSPVILHVPHSATDIPKSVRRNILLTDAELATEIAHMTDAHTAHIALAAANGAALRPWVFVNQLSRLVVDPERFPDDREDMLSVGMGAVYTSTSHGQPLRFDEPTHSAALLADYFHPYASAFADLVDDRLHAAGRAVIIDVHSYPRAGLPYERRPAADRPAICLGVDAQHTPRALAELAARAFSPVGTVGVNEPFTGTYVPLRHLGRETRVESLMVEIRRDTYMTEPGGPVNSGLRLVTAAFDALLAGSATLVA